MRAWLIVRCAASSLAYGHATAEFLSPEAFANDGECSRTAGLDREVQCSLNAMQLRARLGHSPVLSPDDKESYQKMNTAADTTTSTADQAAPSTTASPPVTSINDIVVRGNFLYDSVTGKRFFAKGVAYNPRNDKYSGISAVCKPGEPVGGTYSYTEDVQAEKFSDSWSVDLESIANLSANTVRLYNVDPRIDHTAFMDKAASLGLYVIVPLTGKDWGYLPAFPSPDCYTREVEGYGNVGINLLNFAKQIVKQFSQFPNTLFFTVANEVGMHSSAAFPCVKALTRDIHRYQRECASSMRRVPLIYSDNDGGSAYRKRISKYLTCAQESIDDVIDAYGLNAYSWCDEKYPPNGTVEVFNWSPYGEVAKDMRFLSVPFLFTEFGCNKGAFETSCPYKGGRTWPQVKHLIGKHMEQEMSGAVAFQWSMDHEEYGLTLSPNFLANQSELRLLDNYFALQKAYQKYNVSSKWDSSSAAVSSCTFLPSDVAHLRYSHKQQRCSSKTLASIYRLGHGKGNFKKWKRLPPMPKELLSKIILDWGFVEAQCPNRTVSAAVLQENNCHTTTSTTADMKTAMNSTRTTTTTATVRRQTNTTAMPAVVATLTTTANASARTTTVAATAN
eukprot:TRINITY_DN19117_c0_g1_i2.p1 TRINITY_DN19117_c0_g1~~TRINITY_DN19117_c0_g1_i2.p1  ORF type:complete len:617 (+),score=87.11 TRINITY_DN19117_c0_g1_i2:64-1914(+)